MVRRCASCKLESPWEEAFHTVKRGSEGRSYCPRCWQKRRHTSARDAWLALLGIAAIGLLGVALVPGYTFGWFLINVTVVFLLAELLTLPHELGHALVARLLGLRVFGIYLGSGKT